MRHLLMIVLIVAGAVFLVKTAREGSRPVIIYREPNPPRIIEPVNPSEYAVRTPSVAHRTKRGRSVQESVTELTVTGGARKSREEAWTAALEKAASAIESEFGLSVAVPPEEVEKKVVDSKEDEISAGEPLGDVKKVSVTVQLDGDYLKTLGRREREVRMSERMLWLSRGLAVVVAGLFAIAGYVRLDEWSKGYYSGNLKALALGAVVAVGFGAWYLR